jgi:hypothetical protein
VRERGYAGSKRAQAVKDDGGGRAADDAALFKGGRESGGSDRPKEAGVRRRVALAGTLTRGEAKSTAHSVLVSW